MTDASGTALIITAVSGSIVAVVGAFASAFVLIRGPIHTVSAKVQAVDEKVEGVQKVVDQVHVLTNGAMSAQMEFTTLALRQNAGTTKALYGIQRNSENKALADSAEQAAVAAEEKLRIHRESQEAAKSDAAKTA
jgi:hypothetical protein